MTAPLRPGTSGPLAQIAVLKSALALGNCPANDATDHAVPVLGAEVGDTITVVPLGVWDPGLVMGPHRCLIAGTVQVRIGNLTAAPIVPAAQDCKFILDHTTP
jgi:hypothetical protein